MSKALTAFNCGLFHELGNRDRFPFCFWLLILCFLVLGEEGEGHDSRFIDQAIIDHFMFRTIEAYEQKIDLQGHFVLFPGHILLVFHPSRII